MVFRSNGNSSSTRTFQWRETESITIDDRSGNIWSLHAKEISFCKKVKCDKEYLFMIRYALEGNEAMVPCIDAIFSRAAELGVTDVVVAMPHRYFSTRFY